MHDRGRLTPNLLLHALVAAVGAAPLSAAIDLHAPLLVDPSLERLWQVGHALCLQTFCHPENCASPPPACSQHVLPLWLAGAQACKHQLLQPPGAAYPCTRLQAVVCWHPAFKGSEAPPAQGLPTSSKHVRLGICQTRGLYTAHKHTCTQALILEAHS